MIGEDIIRVGLPHVGERYVFGASVPLDHGSYHGPWDCAEFVSWCAYQAYGVLMGAFGNSVATADPYSGKWYDDARTAETLIPVADALGRPGTILVRKPGDFGIKVGHVVISMGDGRVLEARSARYGVVVTANAGSRHWTSGLEIPGVTYSQSGNPRMEPPGGILRLSHPFMRGPETEIVQRALVLRQHNVDVDGIYGPQTASAVANFQLESGILVDGEVGYETASALGLNWPLG